MNRWFSYDTAAWCGVVHFDPPHINRNARLSDTKSIFRKVDTSFCQGEGICRIAVLAPKKSSDTFYHLILFVTIFLSEFRPVCLWQFLSQAFGRSVLRNYVTAIVHVTNLVTCREQSIASSLSLQLMLIPQNEDLPKIGMFCFDLFCWRYRCCQGEKFTLWKQS